MFTGSVGYSASIGIYLQKGDGSELRYFKGWSIQFRGSKDVYYVNAENSNVYVYREKERLSGCLPVTRQDEREKVFKALNTIGIFSVTWTESNVITKW